LIKKLKLESKRKKWGKLSLGDFKKSELGEKKGSKK